MTVNHWSDALKRLAMEWSDLDIVIDPQSLPDILRELFQGKQAQQVMFAENPW